jgi:hypothetical protein
MELEIKNYSKLYLRRTLRSIFPQRKKCPEVEDINKYSSFMMFKGNTDQLQFISFFNFSMKCFFEGNGKLIASDKFVRYVITYFWRQKSTYGKLRDQIKKIYKCIVVFFPEKVEKRIKYFIKESYISGELNLLIDFADSILPRQKITSKNFLDYLRRTNFSECKHGFVEPIDSYEYTNFYLKYFDN